MPFTSFVTRQANKRAIGAAVILTLAAALLSSCSMQSTHLVFVTSGSGNVQSFRVRSGNGKVENVLSSPFLVGHSTAGVVVLPSNQFALVSNQADGTILKLAIDLDSGTLTEKARTSAGIAPGPMILDSSGAFLYVADQALNQILVFSVSSNGDLSQVSTAQLAGTPSDLTLAASGLLFVTVPALSDIYVFTVSSGSLTQVCSSPGPVCLPLKVNDGVASLAVDPAGKFLYVPNPGTNTVSGFAIQAGGTLVPVPGIVFATGSAPAGSAVDPTGHFLYVANSGSSNISEYSIDASTGELTALLKPTQGAGSSPRFITFDPDNKFMYVANSGSLGQFFIQANGTFFTTGNSLPIGSNPRAVAFTH